MIIHLLGENPKSIAEMVRKLEGLENILAVEIGLPLECDSTMLRGFIDAALGELPTVISLEYGHLPEMLETLVELQPAAVHLRTPRGTLPDAKDNLASGRLYGPAMFPLALNAIQRLTSSGLRIIAGGGVFSHAGVQAILNLEVFAVSLDAVLWQCNAYKVFD
ncbi:MAG: hypothetical protein ACOCYU_00390 [Brevefilum sp.]